MGGKTEKSEGAKQKPKRAEQNWLLLQAFIAFNGHMFISKGENRGFSVYHNI